MLESYEWKFKCNRPSFLNLYLELENVFDISLESEQKQYRTYPVHCHFKYISKYQNGPKFDGVYSKSN